MEDTITASQLTRELLDRCIKAEAKVAYQHKLITMYARAVHLALGVRNDKNGKSRAYLLDALNAHRAIDENY